MGAACERFIANVMWAFLKGGKCLVLMAVQCFGLSCSSGGEAQNIFFVIIINTVQYIISK